MVVSICSLLSNVLKLTYMKQLRLLQKGLSLLLLLAINISQSQTINTTYKTQINAKLAGLDKTKVPNSLLINQAMEFAELTDYCGALTTTNWATKGKFTSIYNTLLMSRVQTAVPSLVSPTVFRTNWDNLREPNKITLSGLYYKYSKFKPDAYPNYLTNNADIITDKYVGGVWQNPYIDQQVFAVASPILIYKSLALQVTLPASLWYTNQSTAIQSIAIDFGDGLGYQTMALGQILTVNYATSGTFEWKYKLSLTNAQILYSHSKLKIDIPVPLIPPTGGATNAKIYSTQTVASCADVAVVPFIGTRQYLGVANTATLQIKYAQNDCIIRKPLIVVEGFDSGLLGIENPFGEVNYIDFLYSTFASYDLYYQSSTYDIIYVNYNKGRDDLKRNAYLVEDIIKWVNTQKANAGSTTPNVIIGQSMGGVIARYALRDMEVLGQAHQTSLFISHDAPQQGANIPLGVQYFARHLADQFIDTPLGDYKINVADGANISISDIQNLFDSQGTKQLLSNYIDSGFNLNNSAFNTFQTELRGMGYPNQTRNIALSNGNHCANPQEFNPSATLFSLSGGASTTALTTFLTVLIEPITGISFPHIAYEFNEPSLLLGMLPGSSSFSMDFNASALPTAGTSNQIYHGNISYTKVLFNLLGWKPQITVSLTDRSYNNPVQLSYDYYPGGKYQLPFDFTSTTVNNDFYNLGISAYLAPSFDFIPVPSALDIGGGSTALTNSDYLRKYNSAVPPVTPFNSPFANFTTSFPNVANTNEPHISFNTRNGNWLAKEIDNITNNNDTFDCTYICSENQIIGSSLLCSTSNYSVPTGAIVNNWTITQGANLVTLTGNGTPNITLTPLTNVAGQVTLSLTMGDNGAKCGNVTLTKTITVYALSSIPTPSGSFSVPIVDCYSDGPIPITFYPSNSFYGDITYTPSLLPHPLQSQTKNITVKYTNPCSGAFTSKVLVFNYYAPNCTTSSIYKVYPNPSKSTINVSLTDETLKPITTSKIIAELYDFSGQSKQKVEVKNNTASIDVAGLQKGVYILNIIIDGNTEGHQVIIE